MNDFNDSLKEMFREIRKDESYTGYFPSRFNPGEVYLKKEEEVRGKIEMEISGINRNRRSYDYLYSRRAIEMSLSSTNVPEFNPYESGYPLFILRRPSFLYPIPAWRQYGKQRLSSMYGFRAKTIYFDDFPKIGKGTWIHSYMKNLVDTIGDIFEAIPLEIPCSRVQDFTNLEIKISCPLTKGYGKLKELTK